MKRTYWFEWLVIYSVIGIYIYESFNPLGDKVEYWIGPAGLFLSNVAIWVIFFKCLYEVFKDSALDRFLNDDEFDQDSDEDELNTTEDETEDNDR